MHNGEILVHLGLDVYEMDLRVLAY